MKPDTVSRYVLENSEKTRWLKMGIPAIPWLMLRSPVSQKYHGWPYRLVLLLCPVLYRIARLKIRSHTKPKQFGPQNAAACEGVKKSDHCGREYNSRLDSDAEIKWILYSRSEWCMRTL